MKLLAALFATLLVAAPLSAQEAPKVERKETRTARVVKIENGKVIELEGEEAKAELEKMRAEMERLRKELQDKIKGIEILPEDWDSEDCEEGACEPAEEADGLEGLEGALKKLREDPFKGMPEEVRARFNAAMEKAKSAAKKAQEEGGDVDVEVEETSADGSSQVKIKIVRRTSKSSEPAPEAPKEAPKSERQQ